MFKIIKNAIDFFKILKKIILITEKKTEIVFYSENKSYQKYSYLLIKILLKKFPNKILYVSSDEADKIDLPNIENLYVGKYLLMNYFFSKVKSTYLFLTTTDLGNNQLKKNKNISNYVYFFHSPASTFKIYTEKAFDNYDFILCNGEYQVNEIKHREKSNKLKSKKLFKTGYFYFDYLKSKIDSNIAPFEILIAPSWNLNHQNFFNTNFENIIDICLKKNYSVRFRPHPETLKRSKEYIYQIKKKYNNNNFILDTSPENLISLLQAKYLITDNSGIAIEFILVLNKPVLYFDDKEKIHNTKFHEFKNFSNMDDIVKEKFGYVFKKDEATKIESLIEKSEIKFSKNKFEINQFLNQNFYNYGNTTKYFENEILKKL